VYGMVGVNLKRVRIIVDKMTQLIRIYFHVRRRAGQRKVEGGKICCCKWPQSSRIGVCFLLIVFYKIYKMKSRNMDCNPNRCFRE
jgi:hypothetical protein